MFFYVTMFFVIFFGGFIAIIVVVKLRQVHAASRWPQVRGQIISGETTTAEVTTRHATDTNERDVREVRNFANIKYRYSVAGKQFTGSRVSIGDDMGNDELEIRMKRYPKGRSVTVFYDPADPASAVLERDLPSGCARGGLIGLALLAAIIAIFGFGLDYAVEFVAPRIHSSGNASSVIFASTFSVLTAIFALTVWNQGRAASKWPRARGQIVASRDPTASTPIVYRYEVNGISYKSDKVIQSLGQSATHKLPSGETIRGGVSGPVVEVFYNPANPAECCLSPGGANKVALAIAAVSIVVAGFAWMIATGD